MTALEKASIEYADTKLAAFDSKLSATSYSRHTKMRVQIFNGNDIEEAFEDGVQWMLQHIEDYIKVLKENQNIQEE